MKFIATSALVLGILFVADSQEQPGCDTDTDCSPHQCCREAWRFTVVSKRFLSLYPSLDNNRGSCVDYIQQDGDCHYLWPSDCGCAPDLQCNTYNDEGELVKDGEGDLRRKRDYIAWPGYSLCEKTESGPTPDK